MEQENNPTHVQAPKTSPKDFFIHLLHMVLLYGSIASLTTAVFQIINITIPDPVSNGEGFNYMATQAKQLLRGALSYLIVFFPVFIGLSMFLNKNYRTNPEKRNLRVRRWLIYFTLFVAIITILSSLVGVVDAFLNGELTLRFGLKVLTLLVVSCAVVGYYGIDIKKHKTE